MQKIKSTKKSKGNEGSSSTEPAIPTTFKKFRMLPEVEAFYRFIYENDLRKEGKKILERILLQRKAAKTASKKSRKKKTLN